jgi:hypothetical protein
MKQIPVVLCALALLVLWCQRSDAQMPRTIAYQGVLCGIDSLGINTICMDGVNMAAVQALEKRTSELREKAAEIEVLKRELSLLKAVVARLEHTLLNPNDLTER